MRVRGLALPDGLVRCIETGALRRSRGSWPLRLDRDAYGHPWQAELGQIFGTAAEIERESSRLPADFPSDTDGDAADPFSGAPGFMPYITDFSRILAFALAGDGAPYCLDYRERGRPPSVIWWDDAYWRRVAPDFGAFVSLFEVKLPP